MAISHVDYTYTTSLHPITTEMMNTTSDNLEALSTDASLTSNETQCRLYDFIMEGLFMGVLCIVGFCGNTLSILCLLRDRSKTATPFLLVSLEAADSFFLLTVLLLRVWTSMPFDTQKVEPYLSKFMFPLALVAMTVTIYMTLLVTANRYISVCRPYVAHDLCSRANAQKHIILVMTFALIYNLPRFFERELFTYIDTTTNETITSVKLSTLGSNYYFKLIYNNILYFLVMFLIPLSTLIVLNYQLIVALRAAKRRRAMMQSCEHSRSEEDITLILIVVVLVFLVTQTPALSTQILLSFVVEATTCNHWLFYYGRVSDLLVVFNSAINFIIYCFCSRRFRQILVVLVCPDSRIARQASYLHRASYRNLSRSRRKKSQLMKSDHNKLTNGTTKLTETSRMEEKAEPM